MMAAYCVFLLFARLFVVVMAVCRKDIDMLRLFFNLYTVLAHKALRYLSSSSTLANCLPGCFLASSIRA